MIEVSEKIISYIISLFGEKAALQYVDFIKREPSTYIRINPLKTTPEKLSKKLKNNYNIDSQILSNVQWALKIISSKNVIGKTIEHIIGNYYIQSLSSMIPPLILNPSQDDKVLDLCSAPGSKTTQLGAIMGNSGTLIANEIALDRVKMLAYNVDRMNLMNAGIINFKGEQLSKIYDNYFDKILVDAPCSGLGIIQKKGEVSNWWNLQRAERLGDLQLRLLIAAIKMLKVGGEIVYSTCTLTFEENEFIIDKVLQKYPVSLLDFELPIESQKGFTDFGEIKLKDQVSKTRRIIPWLADTDGFFIAKLKKTGETASPEKLSFLKNNLKLLNFESKEINKLLKNICYEFEIDEKILANYSYIKKNSDIYFIKKEWYDENLSIFQRIGTRFGIIDKNNEITLHTQAAQVLSESINKKIFLIDNEKDVKKYLEGGIIKSNNLPKGQCVIKYDDLVLGTAVVTNGGLKSQFPRAKRTQEILYY